MTTDQGPSGSPTPEQIHTVLNRLHFTPNMVGRLVVDDERAGRRWVNGRWPMPPPIWNWLREQAADMRKLPSVDGWQRDVGPEESANELRQALFSRRWAPATFGAWVGTSEEEVRAWLEKGATAPAKIAALGRALNQLYQAHPVPPQETWKHFIDEVADREIAEKKAARARGEY